MQDTRKFIGKGFENDSALRPRLNIKLQKLKRHTLFKLTLLISLFSIIAFAVRMFVYPELSEQSVLYLQLAEIGIMGYFVIRILSELAAKLISGHSEAQARSARSIIRIGGLLIILAIVVVTLAKDPYVTLAVTTITGISLAISIQSVIGNAVSGMVLAVVRPFKIGDAVTVFGITGTVKDIGLLYVKLATIPDNKTVLVPNGTMLGTAIIKERTQKETMDIENSQRNVTSV